MNGLESPVSLSQTDLLLTNATVLTLDDAGTVFAPGAVAVRGAEILAVGPQADIVARFTASRTLDCAGCVILPGLVNSHTHAAMTLFRGLADDLPLMEWLHHHIFPAEQKLTAEWVYWGSLLACAEMIRSGTTAFCDMYLWEHAVARAANEAGMRALLGEVFFDFPSPNYGALDNGFTFVREFAETWKNDPRLSIAVMPHSTYTCGPDTLRRSQQLAEELNLPLHLHLAENAHETATVKKLYGVRPVRHLERLGLLTPRLRAAHCVELTAREIELFGSRGVKVAHCPESNMKLACGDAPIRRLLHHGVTVGLGTDGCASNNNLDIFGEMDMCAKLHKLTARDCSALPAATVLKLATRHGAAVLGREDRLGQIRPGFLADLIAVDFRAPHLTPVYDPVSHLVYSASGADVRHTIVHGRLLMENRRLLTLDEDRILAKANEFAARLKTS